MRLRDGSPGTVYLKDYRPSDFMITRTELYFDLHDESVVVSSRLHLQRSHSSQRDAPLRLHGEELELVNLALDGTQLHEGDYWFEGDVLVVERLPDECVLDCTTQIKPQENTSLSGLYRSRGLYCTQCEAEGFRRITYYLDRPDVMSVFCVTVEADSDSYPVLLSNGNPGETEVLDGGRHRVVWNDPHPKPSYLFALVAGDLRCVQDTFTTAGGRAVILNIHVEEKDLDKCEHAMRSLQEAMRWDEVAYGCEYDLDVFNIVAVDDFNMGAMENKGLNIFNTACVLCNPEITTDLGFQRVEAIVAHEYFHNWSGNRVTCRDWFQLSLKEGFTVFRDGQFSSDMGSSTVKRVADANLMRTAQFAEDAGPMSHPIRPESFMEINNFYTLTVYEKGAEVVRMIHTLLGAERFRAGSDLYFQRYDGQAATCENFIGAMEEGGGIDLAQFRNWYSQAGTPEVTVSDAFDEQTGCYTLTVEQSCPATPGQREKAPFVIPLAMGLLGEQGNLPLRLQGAVDEKDAPCHRVLVVDQPKQSYVFEGIKRRQVPSLLRGFSAPVRLHYNYSQDDLCALMRRDGDGFARWDAAQALSIDTIVRAEQAMLAGHSPTVDDCVADAWRYLLDDPALDPAMVAEMMHLPAEDYLAELASQAAGANVDAIHQAREAVQKVLGERLQTSFRLAYDRLEIKQSYAPDASQIARRSLRNTCLSYLVSSDRKNMQLATLQYQVAGNMTDRLAALKSAAFYGEDGLRDTMLDDFYENWREESLVVNQWLQVQAMIPDDRALARVQRLMSHEAFDLRNPNKVRALVGAFTTLNPVNFHRVDASGYRLLADIVLQLNTVNPQIAARLLTPLTRWRNYAGRQDLMRSELERLAAAKTLSPDVYEVVTKSLE